MNLFRFHFHKWKAVRAQQYEKVRYKIGRRGTTVAIPHADITLVLYQCEECGLHKQEEFEGEWAEKDLGITATQL